MTFSKSVFHVLLVPIRSILMMINALYALLDKLNALAETESWSTVECGEPIPLQPLFRNVEMERTAWVDMTVLVKRAIQDHFVTVVMLPIIG